MSLFQCDSCGCCENTALTGGYLTFNHSHLDFSEIPERQGMRLCSACTPSKFKDGTLLRKGGAWHNKFERVYLPKGAFHTNNEGNLVHTESGSEHWRGYAL